MVKRPEKTKPDYIPLAWVQVSGDVERDAKYVLGLTTRGRRLHEMWRLEHFHGWRHADAVAERVKAMWPQREMILNEVNN